MLEIFWFFLLLPKTKTHVLLDVKDFPDEMFFPVCLFSFLFFFKPTCSWHPSRSNFAISHIIIKEPSLLEQKETDLGWMGFDSTCLFPWENMSVFSHNTGGARCKPVCTPPYTPHTNQGQTAVLSPILLVQFEGVENNVGGERRIDSGSS